MITYREGMGDGEKGMIDDGPRRVSEKRNGFDVNDLDAS